MDRVRSKKRADKGARRGMGPVVAREALLVAGVLVGGYFFMREAQHTLPDMWEWQRMLAYIAWKDAAGWHAGLLLRGLATTVRLGVWSGALALLVGGLVGVWTARSKGWLALPGMAFMTLLRNTPPLVLLFLLYFFASERLFSGLDDWVRGWPAGGRELVPLCFAPVGQVDRMAAAVLTLGLYEGAYVSEIVRAGLQSLPRSQWDAAAALGFSRWQRLRLIVGPQALPLMLPPLAGQCVSIFKDSALASLISVPDLTFQGMEIMSVSRLPFESWILVGGLYLLLSLACVGLFQQWQGRLRWRSKPFS
ncbi:MAG: amino acid ABC transporter permease [Desulfovibrionaceae bacterium]